jgi:hypothetical protein
MTAFRHGFPRLIGLALLASLVGPTAGAAGDASTVINEQRLQLSQTLNTLRNVGTAMWAWYHEEVERQKIGRSLSKGPAPKTVDFSTVPAISAAELEKLLVPRYIGCVPKLDGWGNPVEYRLNTRDLGADQVMALRSTGGDGNFSGIVYEIGPFPADQVEQDMVWIDGYFARWPRADEKPGKAQGQDDAGPAATSPAPGEAIAKP